MLCGFNTRVLTSEIAGLTHQTDGDILLRELLTMAGHHLLQFQLLHYLLLLQVRVLLLGDGARQLLRVGLRQRDLKLSCQRIPKNNTQ